jgi:mannose-6-phosphate isomerase-like protein (cupin superfamily)
LPILAVESDNVRPHQGESQVPQQAVKRATRKIAVNADFQVRFKEALARIPKREERKFATVFEHGTLEVEIYTPKDVDRQQPHSRDEVYVIARGKGEFVQGDQRVKFTAGDFLFAPAGVPHRFEKFSKDFATWVMFYGPVGGEK